MSCSGLLCMPYPNELINFDITIFQPYGMNQAHCELRNSSKNYHQNFREFVNQDSRLKKTAAAHKPKVKKRATFENSRLLIHELN